MQTYQHAVPPWVDRDAPDLAAAGALLAEPANT
jgi:hypothetical protein